MVIKKKSSTKESQFRMPPEELCILHTIIRVIFSTFSDYFFNF